MRTRAVSSSPRAHSILLTYRCTSSVREARKPLRDNKHGQTASHLCQEFWGRIGHVCHLDFVTALVRGQDRQIEHARLAKPTMDGTHLSEPLKRRSRER